MTETTTKRALNDEARRWLEQMALDNAADAQEGAEFDHKLNARINLLLAALAATEPKAGGKPFQERVQPWLMACFGEMIAGDREERNHRFLEEALELVQACGCTASEAHQLVDYVYGREVGDPPQEVGGVMVTLAALCLANGLDMHANAETELARIWTKVEAIRAKQAAKPKHSPLPQHVATPQQQPSAELGAGRQHVMPGDPTDLCQTALQWYLGFNFGFPHSVRESNIAVEGFKDGYRAALRQQSAEPDNIGGVFAGREGMFAAPSVPQDERGSRDGQYYADGRQDERVAVLDHLRAWQAADGDKEPGWLDALAAQIESGEHIWGSSSAGSGEGASHG